MKLSASSLIARRLTPPCPQANEDELDETDYLVDHSIVLYLHTPEGEFLDFFTQRMQVGEIVDKVLRHAKEHEATKKQQAQKAGRS